MEFSIKHKKTTQEPFFSPHRNIEERKGGLFITWNGKCHSNGSFEGKKYTSFEVSRICNQTR